MVLSNYPSIVLCEWGGGGGFAAQTIACARVQAWHMYVCGCYTTIQIQW